MKIVDLLEGKDCPLATQDLKLNTKNRNSAIKAKHIQYGPLNLSDESYWDRLAKHWNTSAKVAKKSLCGNCAAFDVSPRMEKCMPGMVQKDGVLGYCHMHKFKCHSKRTCYTWAAGGPIKQDSVSYDWGKKEESAMKISDLISERRRDPGDNPGEEEREEIAKEIDKAFDKLSDDMFELIEEAIDEINGMLDKHKEYGGDERVHDAIKNAMAFIFPQEQLDVIDSLTEQLYG